MAASLWTTLSGRTWLWATGVQSWLVWVVGPRVYRGREASSPLDVVLAALPALVLALAYLRSRNRGQPEVWLTLTAFPVALTAAMCRFDPQLALATYSPAVLLIGALSLLAFAASASEAATRPDQLRATTVQPLGESHQAATDPRRARGQRLLLWTTSACLLGLIVVGSWDTALRYHEAWEATAAAGATLTATVAGLVGAVAMAGIVGPSLRAERPRGSAEARRARSRRRLLWLSTVAVSGAVSYLLLRLSDGG